MAQAMLAIRARDPDDDADRDGLCGDVDTVLRNVANVEQADVDDDGLGDACDQCPADNSNDVDDDGVAIDNCPEAANPEQDDVDGDRIGDACDVCPRVAANDMDGDMVCETLPVSPGDNCPADANPEQLDSDADGVGDVMSARLTKKMMPMEIRCVRLVKKWTAATTVLTIPIQTRLISTMMEQVMRDTCTQGGPLDPDGDAFCAGSRQLPRHRQPPGRR